MADAHSKRTFDPRVYVERPIDEEVVKACRTWAATEDRSCWISLSTASGHGNSWLLESLAEKFSRGSGANLLLQPVIVGAPELGAAPSGFTPLQEALTARRRRGSWIKRALQRVRSAASLRPLVFILSIIALIAIGAVAHSGNQYLNEPGNPSFADFFERYLVTHWWQAIGMLLISVVFSLACFALTRFLIHDPNREDQVSDSEKRQYLTIEGLAACLAEYASNRVGVILLVDRAHRLPAQDSALLLDLQRRSPDNQAIVTLRDQFRFVIVTVDEMPTFAITDRAAKKGMPSRVDDVITLPVPDEFTRAELLEIAAKQRPKLYDRLKDETDDEARSLLDEAVGNIHALMGDIKGLIDIAGERFIAAEGRNTDGVAFGPESILLYQAVRIVGGVGKPRCEKKELADWLRDFLGSGHLERFGVPGPASEKDLLDDLRESSGVLRYSGSVLSFDVTLCRAIVEWARDNRPPLAARAYYYWLQESSRTAAVDAASLVAAMPSQTKRHALKKAAWFAMEMAEFSDATTLVGSLVSDARRKVCADVARALVGASIVYAREGDTQIATSAMEDIGDWLSADVATADPGLADLIVMHAWELYWLSADQAVYDMLLELGESVPLLKERQPWLIEARFDCVAHGRAAKPWRKSSKRSLPPTLTNRGALAETWRVARSSPRGFLFLFDNPQTPQDQADTPHFPSQSATALRLLTVASAHDLGKASEALDRWTGSLRPQADSGCVGDEVLLVYERAALSHSRVRIAIGSADRDDREAHAEEAARAYDRALLLSSLIGWRGLTAELSFHFGRLLYELALIRREEDWDTWEAAFGNTVTLERDAGWLLYAPEIHNIRWIFFRSIAVERCLEDAYSVYETSRQLVSTPVFLDLHEAFRTDFNNGGRYASDPDRALERATNLFVEWADSLASLPEAKSNWAFALLEVEQASSLGYAAQARRLAQDADAADELLDRAEALLAAIDPADPERRTVSLSLRYQRTLLFRDDPARRSEAARALWSEIQFDDQLFPLALGLIVAAEVRAEMLGEPWPADEAGALAPDAVGQAVSLDPAWIASKGFKVRNRFEYRFRQLQYGFECSTRLADYVRPTVDLGDWALDYEVIETIRADLIDLLTKSVALTRAHRLESEEIDVLRLMLTVTSDASVHAQYVAAIARFERLFERERKLASEGLLGWYALADRLHHYFHMLVDDDLLEAEYVQAMRAAGIDPNASFEEQKARIKGYAEARQAFQQGSAAKCVAILDEILPPQNAHWVFWEDLRALQLWFEATSALSDTPQLTDRAQQLRAFTMRYVRQLSITVEDAQIRLIALKLLKFLEEGVLAAARIPILEQRAAPTTPPPRAERLRPSAP